MAKVQKTYTQEFKREAVRLAQSSGNSIAQVDRELGISDSSIHQWRKELAEHGPDAFPGSGHQTALEEENRRLKRELERTRQERDILKKTVSIFFHHLVPHSWPCEKILTVFFSISRSCRVRSSSRLRRRFSSSRAGWCPLPGKASLPCSASSLRH
jgi:transposase